MRLLKKQNSLPIPTDPTVYPAGTFVRTEAGYFYIASPSKRYHLVSKIALDSWSPPRVVESTESAVRQYRIATKMKFRNGSLLSCLGDDRIYLIVGGERRPVATEDLWKIGARESDVLHVSLDELGGELT